jgi:hypothetical protein
MSFLLKDTIHQSLAETVYNEILSRRSSYYYFIGNIIEWADENNPPAPEATQDYEYDTRNNIIAIKKINVKDASLVVPRRDWVSGTVYDQYDGNYSASYPAESGATKLKDAAFYVLSSDFNVYVCLFNNNGANSTIEPEYTDATPITTADGYVWKYLYTIPLSLRNRFLTTAYMPVQRAVTNSFYSNGQISSIVIDNAGTGYLGNALVTLTVNGQFLGLTGNVVANLTPVFNTSGKIIDVVINNPGVNYKTATITITDSLGSGTSLYKGISNVKIYSPGTLYYTNVVANTTVTISTSGNVQPTANAAANLIFSSNALVDIVLTNPGSGYTSAVQANTTISISTSGNVQPTSNASANLFFNSSAILKPVLYNGTIDRVLIEDPGTSYSSNIQTSISLIGDGTGAILTPFINTAGQLEDIIIEDPGSGYSYADIDIVGDGTGANAYTTLSIGDVDTLQNVVELSAIDGAVYAFRVHNSGNGYSYANVSVSGDGTGFIGNVVITNNTVNYITVINPGIGYTYANVIITGDGANANVSAILSPYHGHGFDPVKALFADTVLLYSTINNEANQGVVVNNDYRQFGIIKDIKKFNSEDYYSNITGSSCYLVTVNSVGSLARDTELALSGNTSRLFDVVETVPATNQILINNKNNYTISVGNILVDALSNTNYTITAVNNTPGINKFSGDLLYIDNRTTASYSDQQLVTLRTIIRL